MSVAVTFDTLRYTKRLENANIPRDQAEAQAGALAEVFDAHLQELATKDDVKAVKDDVKAVKDDVIAVRDDVIAVRDDVIAVRDDVKAVRDDVIALQLATKDDVIALREQMATKDDVKALRGDVVRMDKQLVVIKWMLAIVVAVTVLPALKALL